MKTFSIRMAVCFLFLLSSIGFTGSVSADQHGERSGSGSRSVQRQIIQLKSKKQEKEHKNTHQENVKNKDKEEKHGSNRIKESHTETPRNTNKRHKITPNVTSKNTRGTGTVILPVTPAPVKPVTPVTPGIPAPVKPVTPTIPAPTPIKPVTPVTPVTPITPTPASITKTSASGFGYDLSGNAGVGSPIAVGFSVTSQNNVISAATITVKASDNESIRYQQRFGTALSAAVVGKKLSDVAGLSTIGGASYTTIAFKKFIAQ